MCRQFGSCKGGASATPRHKLLLRFRHPSPGTHHHVTASPTCLSAPPQGRRDSLAEETRLARSCPHWIRSPGSYFDTRPNMNARCMPPVPLGRPSTGDFPKLWFARILHDRSEHYSKFVCRLTTPVTPAHRRFARRRYPCDASFIAGSSTACWSVKLL